MKIDVNANSESVVMSFTGFLDFESVGQFSEVMNKLSLSKKLVFDFKDLEFVGSSGITSFIDTIDKIYQKHEGQIKLAGVGSDFRKIIEGYNCSKSIESNGE